MIRLKFYWLYIAVAVFLALFASLFYYVYTYSLNQFNQVTLLNIVEVAKSTAIIIGVFIAVGQLYNTYQTRFKDISERNKKLIKEKELKLYQSTSRLLKEHVYNNGKQAIEVKLESDVIQNFGNNIYSFIKTNGSQYLEHVVKCLHAGKVIDHANQNVLDVSINVLKDLYNLRNAALTALHMVNKHYEEGLQIIRKIKSSELNFHDKEELISDLVEEKFWGYIILTEGKMSNDYPLPEERVERVDDTFRTIKCSELIIEKILKRKEFDKEVEDYINPIKPRIEQQIKKLSVITFYPQYD